MADTIEGKNKKAQGCRHGDLLWHLANRTKSKGRACIEVIGGTGPVCVPLFLLVVGACLRTSPANMTRNAVGASD